VLRYDCEYKPAQSTLKRYYNEWRRENGLPVERCDNPDCVFHTQKPEWNGKPLPLILDHRNGNQNENSPSNLRYLCPNCDFQLSTKGGLNRGRVVELLATGYTLRDAAAKFLEHFRHISDDRADKVGIGDQVFTKLVPGG
jgi:hypothetical protein